MANTGAIRAGKAYVELFADSSKLIRGLRAAENTLKAFGQSIQSMGLKIMGLGTAIVLPLLKAAHSAANMGKAIVEMSKRTGVSVESLSALGYAANQSGIDIESLEKAFKFMHKNLFAAAAGSKQATSALGMLGLTVADIKGLSPEEQFFKLSERIGALPDPTTRSAMAMKLFGKAGTSLLPMFALGSEGMRDLMVEAQKLGLVMSTEDAQAAASFYDVLKKLWSVLKMGLFRVGAAVIPILQDFAQKIVVITAKLVEWIKNNRGVIVTVLYFGAALVVGGAALSAFGTAMVYISKVIGTIITVFKALRSVLLWVISPFGAFVSLVAGGAGVFLYFSGYGAKALSWLGERFTELKNDAVAAFGGISAALAKGDVALAAQILWLTLKMEFLKGKEALLTIWLAFKAKFLEYWYGLGYAMVLAWDTAIYGIKIAWIESVAFLKQVWIGFKQWWGDTVDWVAKKMMDAYIWWQSIMDPNFDADFAKKYAQDSFDADAQTRAQETVQQSDAVEAQRASSRDEAGNNYKQQLEITGRAYADDLQTIEKENADRLKSVGDELALTKKTWQDAIDQAKQPGAAGGPKGPPTLPDFNAIASEKASSMGTFSGFALSQLGVGGVAQRIALATELTAKNTGKIYDEMDDGAEFE